METPAPAATFPSARFSSRGLSLLARIAGLDSVAEWEAATEVVDRRHSGVAAFEEEARAVPAARLRGQASTTEGRVPIPLELTRIPVCRAVEDVARPAVSTARNTAPGAATSRSAALRRPAASALMLAPPAG